MRKFAAGLFFYLSIGVAVAQDISDPVLLAIDKRDYLGAITMATQALEDPAVTDRQKLARHFQRGFAKLQAGQAAESLVDLTVTIDGIGQAYPPLQLQLPAYVFRGTAFRMLEKHEEAIADLKAAAKIQPDSAEIFNQLGETYYDVRRGDEAIGAFSEAIRLNPNLATAYVNRGENHQNKKEFDLAIADYTQAIRLKPDYATAYDDRGTALALKGEYREALKDHDKSVALDPNDLHYWNRGGAHLKLNEWQAAIDDLTKAISLTRNLEWRGAMQKSLDEARHGLEGPKSP